MRGASLLGSTSHLVEVKGSGGGWHMLDSHSAHCWRGLWNKLFLLRQHPCVLELATCRPRVQVWTDGVKRGRERSSKM